MNMHELISFFFVSLLRICFGFIGCYCYFFLNFLIAVHELGNKYNSRRMSVLVLCVQPGSGLKRCCLSNSTLFYRHAFIRHDLNLNSNYILFIRFELHNQSRSVDFGEVLRSSGPLVQSDRFCARRTSYQLSVTSCQLLVTSCWLCCNHLPVTNYWLSCYQLPIKSYQLLVKRFQLPVTSYQVPVTSYQVPVTSYQVPVTS